MRQPKTVIALLAALAAGFLLQNIAPDRLVAMVMLWPVGRFDVLAGDGVASVGFMPWQLVTYSFLHGDLGHLLVNALGVWTFGATLEEAWGRKRLLTFWFLCVIGAGLTQLAMAAAGLFGDGAVATIGASGGVYGLLIAFAMLYPNREMMLLIPPIPMKARTLAIIFGVVALLFGVSSSGGIAHFAHLGGMLTGFLVLQYWRGRPPFGPRRPKKPNLRSVN
jgi:membrane associated rhomboid family serine protease